MPRDKFSDGVEKIDQRIARLIKQKEKYIKLCEDRQERQTPRLQKTISSGMSYISNKLDMIRRWEQKKEVLDERIKVLELQIQDRRKVVQTAQEKLREYDTCEPGINNFVRKEREKDE